MPFPSGNSTRFPQIIPPRVAYPYCDLWMLLLRFAHTNAPTPISPTATITPIVMPAFCPPLSPCDLCPDDGGGGDSTDGDGVDFTGDDGGDGGDSTGGGLGDGDGEDPGEGFGDGEGDGEEGESGDGDGAEVGECPLGAEDGEGDGDGESALTDERAESSERRKRTRKAAGSKRGVAVAMATDLWMLFFFSSHCLDLRIRER
ncbi:hypothetical protein Dimus_009855 [Dionaea muscipula]